VLELHGIRHRYGGRPVLEVERFAVTPSAGGFVAVVGPNGSGKSTLLRLLALLERPSEGRVLLDGRAVWQHGAAAVVAARRRVTLVEQRPVLFRGTVRENLRFGLNARAAGAAARAIEQMAERCGVTSLLSRRRDELSDGEVQRIAVARALVVRPDVLLLDEPVSSADRATSNALYRLLEEERRERGLVVCLASHQLEDAYRWADDIRALADGRLTPVTPENLFRVTLPAGNGIRHARVGPVAITVVTDKSGPVIVAVPPTDIVVSREPIASSARNVFAGHVVRLTRQRSGAVHVAADVGVELVAIVTEEAVRELGLTPGAPVVFAFKASAVRVF
jgi:tungstate transport system ATP-binding protein